MKRFILSISVGVAIACAPELSGGKGERCDQLNACSEGFECYRGFCVGAESASDPNSIVEQSDAGREREGAAYDAGLSSSAPSGQGASEADSTPDVSEDSGSGGSPEDAGSPVSKPGSPAVSGSPATTGTTSGPSASADAGRTPVPEMDPANARTPPANNPPAKNPPPAKPPATPPANTPPATPPANTPPASMPPVLDAGPAPAVDAGVSARPDAGVSASPDAAAALPTLPSNCTMQDCCDEALRAAGNNGSPGNGGKRCGCSDPALLPALLGTLTCTLGGVVGGLL